MTLERTHAPTAAASPTATYTLRVEVTDAGGNRRVASANGRRGPDAAASSPGAATSSRRTATRSRRRRRCRWRLARDAKTTLRLYDASGRRRADGVDRQGARARARGPGRGTARRRRRRGPPGPVHRAADASRRRWATLESARRSGRPRSPRSRRSATRSRRPDAARCRSARSEPLATTPRVTFTPARPDRRHRDGERLADGTWKASFTVRAGRAGRGDHRVTAKDAAAGTRTRPRCAIRCRVLGRWSCRPGPRAHTLTVQPDEPTDTDDDPRRRRARRRAPG